MYGFLKNKLLFLAIIGTFSVSSINLISEPVKCRLIFWHILFRWRTMLYIASIPGFILALGMQFAVDSPRWLCKVRFLSFMVEIMAFYFQMCCS